jgi:hypothetical protein
MPLGAARFGLLGGVADLGKLELIETQASNDSALDFTSEKYLVCTKLVTFI